MAAGEKHASGIARWVWRGVLLVAILLLLPYGLTLFYLVANPVSTPMMWRWMTGARVERSWVALSEMSPTLPLAVIVAEDGRFCSHRGIDWRELRDVIRNSDDLLEARGGSTITQQTAKNLFLWQGRSFVRKAIELPLAVWMDLVMPKRRILEIYLNIATWGPDGRFGAEAGARWAFGKSARDLTDGEAALLASILPNPGQRSARQPGAGVRRLSGIYLNRARRFSQLGACARTQGSAGHPERAPVGHQAELAATRATPKRSLWSGFPRPHPL
jgi:monofunctional glycosyltransferase